MADVRSDHAFDCTPEVFWKVFFDDKVMDVVMATVGVKDRRTVYDEMRGEIRHRKVSERPERDLPPAIKKVTGTSDMSYAEVQKFDAKASRLDYEIEPAVMKDKIKVRGTIRVVPEGQSRCRRIMEGTVKVDVFMVGGMIADFIAGQIKDGYDKSVEAMRRAIADEVGRQKQA